MEKIREVYLEGMKEERGNRFNSAYNKYIFCINESVENISLCSFQPGQQNNWNNYMKVAENCLEKLRSLYPKLERQQKPVQTFPVEQPRPTGVVCQTMVSPTRNHPQYSYPTNQTLPSNLSYQSGSIRKTKTKKLSIADEFKKLREQIEHQGMRKMNEMEVQRRHQFQILKMQKENEKQAKMHRRSIKNRLYNRVNWRRNDKWARFIRSNFLYMKMNNEMILKDKKFFENIGKVPTKYLFPHHYGSVTNISLPNQPQSFDTIDLSKTTGGHGPGASPTSLGHGSLPMIGPYRASVLPHDPNERLLAIKDEIRVFIDKYVLFEPPQKIEVPKDQMERSLRFGTAVDIKSVPFHQAEKHKVLVLIERFVSLIRDEYFLPRKHTLTTLNIPMLNEDILSFVQNTVGILLSKFWAVPNEQIGTLVEKQLVNGMYVVIFRFIQKMYTKIDCQVIINTRTQQPPPRIHTLNDSQNFEAKLSEYKKYVDLVGKNRKYNQKIIELADTITLKQLGLKKKYRLDEDEVLHLLINRRQNQNEKIILPYQEVVDMFRQFVERGWVVEKLQITEHCLKKVPECVNEYHLQVHGSNKRPPPVGAEELLPIFVYCLLKTRCVDMFFTFHYIENFLTEDLLRGSMGYSLATLETALNYIANNLTKEELMENERKLNEKEGKSTIVLPSQPTQPNIIPRSSTSGFNTTGMGPPPISYDSSRPPTNYFGGSGGGSFYGGGNVPQGNNSTQVAGTGGGRDTSLDDIDNVLSGVMGGDGQQGDNNHNMGQGAGGKKKDDEFGIIDSLLEDL